MSKRYIAESWSMEVLESWRIDPTDDYVEFRSPGASGVLRLTELPASQAASDWVETVAKAERVKGRTVEPVTLGDFVGYRTEFETGGESFRGWVLRSASSGLDATYRCPSSGAVRDQSDIEAMLGTLQALSPAA